MHVIQRGNNRQACFVAEHDFQRYLEWLRDCARKTGCRVHAYVLMTNHVHLLLTGERASAVSEMMKALGQRYVRYFNRQYHRSGTLWEGRFRSCPTETERYFLTCQRYIELNPVRAGMVAHPAEYFWSSYRANAQGEIDALVEPHEVYRSLGIDAASRQAAWRELLGEEIAPALIEEIRRTTNGNFVFGSRPFADRIASTLGRRVTPGAAGRPGTKATQKQAGEANRSETHLEDENEKRVQRTVTGTAGGQANRARARHGS